MIVKARFRFPIWQCCAMSGSSASWKTRTSSDAALARDRRTSSQALEGHVLVGVPGEDEARLVNAPIKGLHRIVAERLQHLAGPVQSREVPRLLELPR